jgi:hypothetical protein
VQENWRRILRNRLPDLGKILELEFSQMASDNVHLGQKISATPVNAMIVPMALRRLTFVP